MALCPRAPGLAQMSKTTRTQNQAQLSWIKALGMQLVRWQCTSLGCRNLPLAEVCRGSFKPQLVSEEELAPCLSFSEPVIFASLNSHHPPKLTRLLGRKHLVLEFPGLSHESDY